MTAPDTAAAMPPLTPCPAWCAEGFHAWEPFRDGWMREHHSGNLAPPGVLATIRLYAADVYDDGTTVDQAAPVAIVDGPISAGDVPAVLAVLAEYLGVEL